MLRTARLSSLVKVQTWTRAKTNENSRSLPISNSRDQGIKSWSKDLWHRLGCVYTHISRLHDVTLIACLPQCCHYSCCECPCEHEHRNPHRLWPQKTDVLPSFPVGSHSLSPRFPPVRSEGQDIVVETIKNIQYKRVNRNHTWILWLQYIYHSRKFFIPGFGKPQGPVFCKVVQGQWRDSEGCFLFSPPKSSRFSSWIRVTG